MSEQLTRPPRPKYGQIGAFAHKAASKAARRMPRTCAEKPGSAELAADVEKFLPALLADRSPIHALHLVERLGDGIAGGRDHRGGVAVGAADRLLEDGVDDAEAEHVLGGDLHAVGGFLGL